jgi:pyruvate,water dikinase
VSVLVRPLAEAADPAEAGGKAAALCRLAREGVAVPPAAVVTTDAFDRWLAGGGPAASHAALAAAIQAELERWLASAAPGARCAVRSSATVEDGTRASFAGLFTSRLRVEPCGLAVAALDVFASALAPGVERYARRLGIAARPRMAALVQVMVDPAWAGVCFTADPVTGAPGLVVEAVEGLAESLVLGREAPATPPAEVTGMLRATAARIEELFGPGQDIEWAFDGRDLWIVQARPITGRGSSH